MVKPLLLRKEVGAVTGALEISAARVFARRCFCYPNIGPMLMKGGISTMGGVDAFASVLSTVTVRSYNIMNIYAPKIPLVNQGYFVQ